MARALIEAGHVVVYDEAATVEDTATIIPPLRWSSARGQMGRFNIEWLERVCVNSLADAETLDREIASWCVDRELLEAAVSWARRSRQSSVRARALRRAAFVGACNEGGRSTTRRRPSSHADPIDVARLVRRPRFPPDTVGRNRGLYAVAGACHEGPSVMDVVIPHAGASPGRARRRMRRQISRSTARIFRLAGVAHESTGWDSSGCATVTSGQRPKRRSATPFVKSSPDIVHFQHLIHLSVTLPEICRELGVPSLITVNDYWACARASS
jgi:hypothetical protein